MTLLAYREGRELFRVNTELWGESREWFLEGAGQPCRLRTPEATADSIRALDRAVDLGRLTGFVECL